jgi:hypothetical protein
VENLKAIAWTIISIVTAAMWAVFNSLVFSYLFLSLRSSEEYSKEVDQVMVSGQHCSQLAASRVQMPAFSAEAEDKNVAKLPLRLEISPAYLWTA